MTASNITRKAAATMASKQQFLSLACDEEAHEKLHLVSQEQETFEKGVKLHVNKVGLSANNKFYLAFGRNPSFKFFETYPIASDVAKILNSGEKAPALDKLVNPPGWGIATVTDSSYEQVPVGTTFRAMLPLGNQVYFADVTPQPNGDFIATRPKTNPAYNLFAKVSDDSILVGNDEQKAGVALVSWPGTITGFGLYQQLLQVQMHRKSPQEKRVIVVTSASSKVSLALAFYLKQAMDKGDEEVQNVSVVGFTSDGNKKFCEKTGLYESVLSYSDKLPGDEAQYIFVDVAGRADVYTNNESKIVKGYVVGNSQNVPDKDSTFSQFSYLGTFKMIMAMMGYGDSILTRYINPKLELFLIMTISAELSKKWGADGFQQRMDAAMRDFVDAAVDKKWMDCSQCNDLESIQEGYANILSGKTPPSQCVLLNMDKALANVEK